MIPQHFDALRTLTMMKRDLALSSGGILPAVASELFELLMKADQPMHLSRAGKTEPLALAIFDLLAKNKPVPLGEMTGLQVLTRLIPGEENSGLRQRMIDLASGNIR